MKKIARCCIPFLLLPFVFIGAANAADESDGWQACSCKKSSDEELACYRAIAQKLKEQSASNHSDEQGKPENKKSPPVTQYGKLAKEWGIPKEWDIPKISLVPYKQNYVLAYSHSSQTNNAPTSPNPLNNVPYNSWDNRDLKFQLSLKHHLGEGFGGSWWFGYTQLSFWQVWDGANSRPFRESNYEPELIYSYRPDPTEMKHSFGSTLFGLTPSIINVGLYDHQSNGQSNPKSRSWNRAYIQTGLDNGNGDLSVLLRWWRRYKESPVDDDNPDIMHYLGHGDVEVRYRVDDNFKISAIGKAHSIQFDLATGFCPWFSTTNLHFQYFSGYGESLIDYNQHHNTWGIGASFPFQ